MMQASSGRTPDLSIVVISFNMTRELARTLLSLSRIYQRNISDLEYEVIVVDNGSATPPKAQDFTHLDLNLRILDSNTKSQSPAAALNIGLAACRGKLIGVMIDGARIASPGMLCAAVAASRLHSRAIVYTQQLTLGHAPQSKAHETGYNQQVEDRLLASIAWPEDGYRLFEISMFPNRYDNDLRWYAPGQESNAIFMSKMLWDETGGYDMRFQSAGGGAISMDLYDRACALPDVQLVVLSGEATFHQYHSLSATTSNADLHTNMMIFSKEYHAIRNQRPIQQSWPKNKLYWMFKVATTAFDRSKFKNSNANISAADRYIALLKDSILNVYGIEAEAELRSNDYDGNDDSTKSPHSYQANLKRVHAARDGGHMLPGRMPMALTMIGRRRLDNLEYCVNAAINEGISGDLVECGIWRGGAAILMSGMLAARGITDRNVWLADSFMGLPPADASKNEIFDLDKLNHNGLAVTEEEVKSNFARFDLLSEQVKFLSGWFADTLPHASIDKIAVLRLDGDLYSSTLDALHNLYHKVSPGGFIIIDDYALASCAQAVHEFRESIASSEPLHRIDMYGAYWRKEV